MQACDGLTQFFRSMDTAPESLAARHLSSVCAIYGSPAEAGHALAPRKFHEGSAEFAWPAPPAAAPRFLVPIPTKSVRASVGFASDATRRRRGGRSPLLDRTRRDCSG